MTTIYTNVSRFVSAIRSRRIFTDTIWVSAGQISAGFALLVGNRLLTEVIPPVVFGNVSLLVGGGTLASAAVCLPFIQAATKFYPEFVRLSQADQLRHHLYKQLSLHNVLLFMLVAVIGLIYRLPSISYFAYIALGVLIGLDVLRALEISLLSAARNHRSTALAQIGESILRPCLAVGGVLLLGPSPLVVLCGYCLATAFVLIGLRDSSQKRAQRTGDDEVVQHKLSRNLWRFALPLMPVAIVGWTNSLGDRYIIGAIMGPEQVGIYAAGYGILSSGFSLVCGKIPFLTLRPVYFEAIAEKDERRQRRVLLAWIGTTAALSVFATLTIMIFADRIVALVLASEYSVVADAFPILAVAFAFMCLSQIFIAVCMAHNRNEFVLMAEALAVAGVISLGIPLVAALGILGAAVATCVSYFLQLLASFFIARHLMGKATMTVTT